MDINTELQPVQEIKAVREMKNDGALGVVDTIKISGISTAHHPAEDLLQNLDFQENAKRL